MRRASPSATSLERNGLEISVASGEARRYKSPRMDEGEGGSPRRNGRHRMKWGKGRDIASGGLRVRQSSDTATTLLLSPRLPDSRGLDPMASWGVCRVLGSMWDG